MANLKKQRAQSRSSANSETGSIIGTPSLNNISTTTTPASLDNNTTTSSSQNHNQMNGESSELSLLSNNNLEIAPTITKFSGVTSDVVSDSTRTRRCCIIM